MVDNQEFSEMFITEGKIRIQAKSEEYQAGYTAGYSVGYEAGYSVRDRLCLSSCGDGGKAYQGRVQGDGEKGSADA